MWNFFNTLWKVVSNTKYANDLEMYDEEYDEYWNPIPKKQDIYPALKKNINQSSWISEADKLKLSNLLSYWQNWRTVQQQNEIARRRAENQQKINEIKNQTNPFAIAGKTVAKEADAIAINPVETASNISKWYVNNIKWTANLAIDAYNSKTAWNLKKLDTQENKSFVERTADNLKEWAEYFDEIDSAKQKWEQWTIRSIAHKTGGVIDTSLDIIDDAASSSLATIASEKQKEYAKKKLDELMQTSWAKDISELMEKYSWDMEYLKENDPKAYRDYKTAFSLIRAGLEWATASTATKWIKNWLRDWIEEWLEKWALSEVKKANTKTLYWANSDFWDYKRELYRRNFEEWKFVEEPNYLIDYNPDWTIKPESIPRTYFKAWNKSHFLPSWAIREISWEELNTKKAIQKLANRESNREEIASLPGIIVWEKNDIKVILDKEIYKKTTSWVHDKYKNFNPDNLAITLNDFDDHKVDLDPLSWQERITIKKATPNWTQYECVMKKDPKTETYRIVTFYEKFKNDIPEWWWNSLSKIKWTN